MSIETDNIIKDSENKSKLIGWEIVGLIIPLYLLVFLSLEYNFWIGLAVPTISFLLIEIIIELKKIGYKISK